jgi:hypothetical protein
MRCSILVAYLAVSLGGCHPDTAQRGTRRAAGTPEPPGLPVLSIGDAQFVQGHAETTVVRFQVTLSAATHQPVSVRYKTEDVTAIADQDYRPASGTIDFPPNSNVAQSFDVALIGERVIPRAKSFAATLSDAVNATVAGRRGIATILPNDKRLPKDKRSDAPPGQSVTLQVREHFSSSDRATETILPASHEVLRFSTNARPVQRPRSGMP